MSAPTITERKPQVDQSNEGYVAVREFTVLATSEENAKAVLLAGKSITLGTVYQSPYSETPDADAIALNIGVRPEVAALVSGGTGLYAVTVRYGRPQLNGQIVQPVAGGAAVWRKERSLAQETADVDIDGKPVTNTVDEPYDPPVIVLAPQQVLVGTFLREHSTWTAADLIYGQYFGHINDVPFVGAAAGGLLCVSVDVQEIQPELFQIEMRFQYKPPVTLYGTTYEGWDELRINRGRRIWLRSLPDGTKVYAPLEDSGVATTEPQKLDDLGTAVLPAGADPFINVFKFYPRINFNLLGIV